MTEFGVMIATPAYDGRVVDQFAESLKKTLLAMKELGVPAQFESWSGCCYLPIARNQLVKKFLQSGLSDMIFIDADIEWEPEAIESLLHWPVDVVCGAYRTKEYQERYPVWLAPDALTVGGASGLVRCFGVPTGFMRLTRRVLDEYITHYGEELVVDEYDPITGDKTGEYYDIFDTEKCGRQWFGEDINFSRKLAFELKKDLWIDPDIRLTHWGNYPKGHPRKFEGDYGDYLRRLPGGISDPGYQGTDIPGYLMRKEAQWLYSQALEMDSVVEIGTFAGRSAHALLSACKGPVTCVDPWLAMDWHDAMLGLGMEDSQEKAENRYKMFLANTGSFANRIVMRTTSVEAAESFGDKSVDMVWIDADHSDEAVASDIDAWLPKARKIICGHDYEEWGWPAVKQAVDRRFGDSVQTVWGTSLWYVIID